MWSPLSQEEAVDMLKSIDTETTSGDDFHQQLSELSLGDQLLVLCRVPTSRCWPDQNAVKRVVTEALVSAHDDALARKRARHLLAHGQLALEKSQVQLMLPVLECVDESQIHVVRQAVLRLVHIFQDFEQDANELVYWLFVAWHALLRHKNLNVARLALKSMLKCDKIAHSLGKLSYEEMLGFLKNALMPALNCTRNWAKEHKIDELWPSFLGEFLEGNDTSLEKEDSIKEDSIKKGLVFRFNVVCEALFSLKLAPVAMIKLVFSLCSWHQQHSSQDLLQLTESNLEALAALSQDLAHHELPLLRLAAQQRLLEMLLNSNQITLDMFVSEDSNPIRRFMMSLLSHGTRSVITFFTRSVWKPMLELFQALTPEELRVRTMNIFKDDSCVVSESVRLKALFLALIHEQMSFSSLPSSSLVVDLFQAELEHAETRVYNREKLVHVLHLIEEMCLFYLPPRFRRDSRKHLFAFTENLYNSNDFLKSLMRPLLSLLKLYEACNGSKWILEALSSENNVDILVSLVRSHVLACEQSFLGEENDLLHLLEEGLKDSHQVLGVLAYLDTLLGNVKQPNPKYGDLLLKMASRLESYILSDSNISSDNRMSKSDQLCLIHRLSLFSSLVALNNADCNCFSPRINDWLGFGIDIMEKTDSTFVLPSFLKLISTIIACFNEDFSLLLMESEPLQPFIAQALQLVLGHCRKNDAFWPNLTEVVNIIFADNLVHLYSNESSQQWLETIMDQLLTTAETMEGVALILTQRLLHGSKAVSSLTIVHKLALPALLTFGVVPRRESLLLNETKRSIFNDEQLTAASSVAGSDHSISLSVRMCSLKTLMIIGQKDQSGVEEIVELLDGHVNRESIRSRKNEDSKASKRYFFNSNCHLERLRLSQTLLVLTKICQSSSLASAIFDICLRYTTTGSEQTNVRHVMEWTIIRLISAYLSLQDRVWDKLADLDRKSMSVSSLLFILSMTQGTDKKKVLSTLASWCMSQNFSTRLTAQICFLRVFQALINEEERREFSFFASKVEDLLASNILEPEKRDMFIEKFDENKVFTTKDIFVNLPRLSGITQTEWIDFETAGTKIVEDEFVVFDIVSPFEGLDYLEKANSKEEEEKSEDDIDWNRRDVDSVMLVKAVPDIGPTNALASITRTNDLIVVASFLDRPTNLGGLCRTCEIFGLSQMVVADKSVTGHKEFQNLAVTAQNWLDLVQVSPAEVPDFLRAKKSEEYSVLAVEQTTASVKLDDFVMPQKVVLILGNEKEGLPVQLLNQTDLIDVFVEVPQWGHIRSLNVHVTGAILIWEYVRQRLGSISL